MGLGAAQDTAFDVPMHNSMSIDKWLIIVRGTVDGFLGEQLVEQYGPLELSLSLSSTAILMLLRLSIASRCPGQPEVFFSLS